MKIIRLKTAFSLGRWLRRLSLVMVAALMFTTLLWIHEDAGPPPAGEEEEDEEAYVRIMERRLAARETEAQAQEVDYDIGKRSQATRRLPTALIIGVKKCGTRALLEILRMHPGVQAAGPEVHFFDKHYDLGLDWYRAQMPASSPGQLTIEKTPSYYVTREAPARIYNMSRDVRLIIVVRDPVTRALSDYVQTKEKRKEMNSFTEMAITQDGTTVNRTWAGVRLGMYVTILHRWTKYFPHRQIRFVDGEQLTRDPYPEVTQLEEFLGLESYFQPFHFVLNTTKGLPCFRRSPTSHPHCLTNKGRSHPPVDPRTLGMLRDFFKPYNEQLVKKVKRSFVWMKESGS